MTNIPPLVHCPTLWVVRQMIVTNIQITSGSNTTYSWIIKMSGLKKLGTKWSEKNVKVADTQTIIQKGN